jgi:hypothetical protein
MSSLLKLTLRLLVIGVVVMSAAISSAKPIKHDARVFGVFEVYGSYGVIGPGTAQPPIIEVVVFRPGGQRIASRSIRERRSGSVTRLRFAFELEPGQYLVRGEVGGIELARGTVEAVAGHSTRATLSPLRPS